MMKITLVMIDLTWAWMEDGQGFQGANTEGSFQLLKLWTPMSNDSYCDIVVGALQSSVDTAC